LSVFGAMRRFALRLAYAFYSLKWRLFHPVTLGVRLVLLRNGQVMLIRHSYQREWFLPGGGVKRGESLGEAVVREAREEVGAIMFGEPRLVGIYVNFDDGRNDHVALFASESFYLVEPSDQWEIEERGFAAIDALPKELGPRLRAKIMDAIDGSHARVKKG
jgi:ADP-ribose pyrophosphatase YjhB (NUDIX family)